MKRPIVALMLAVAVVGLVAAPSAHAAQADVFVLDLEFTMENFPGDGSWAIEGIATKAPSLEEFEVQSNPTYVSITSAAGTAQDENLQLLGQTRALHIVRVGASLVITILRSGAITHSGVADLRVTDPEPLTQAYVKRIAGIEQGVTKADAMGSLVEVQ